MFRHRLFLIVNPISGTCSKKGVVEKIEARFRRHGIEIDTALTTGCGDATRLAREAVEKGYRAVLACGGDGTVNETARAMCGTDIPLGIIPAGSGNGLARHLGIPIDILTSVDVISREHVTPCDYATANGRPFFCTFGWGFDAAVSDRFARAGKRGLITYLNSAIEEYKDYQGEEYSRNVDGVAHTRKAFLVACCNASQYGNNAFIAPQASIKDGLLDVIIIKDADHLRTLLVGIDMLTGMIPHNSQIEKLRGRHIVITRNSNGPAHLDGEPIEMGTVADIKCIHGALKIFTPQKKMRFMPFVTPMIYTFRDWHFALRNLVSG